MDVLDTQPPDEGSIVFPHTYMYLPMFVPPDPKLAVCLKCCWSSDPTCPCPANAVASSATYRATYPAGTGDVVVEAHRRSKVPGQSATEGENANGTPKKKRRRRKKAELLADEAAAGGIGGTALPGGVVVTQDNDLDLNQSLIMSHFPTAGNSGGHGLPLGLLLLIRLTGWLLPETTANFY